MCGMWILIYALQGAALASDVVLPEFSAGSLSDFEIAEIVTSSVHDALVGAGIKVDGPELLVAEHPDLAVGCAETPGCPAAILARMQGDIALIGHVVVDEFQWTVTCRFFVPGQLNPFLTINRETSQSNLPVFTAEMVEMIRAQLPPPEPTPVAEPEPEPELDPVQVVVVNTPTEDELSDWRLRTLPKSIQERFASSGLPLEDWLERSRVRTGHVYIELLGSAAFGDIARRYDTRVSIVSTDETNFTQSAPYEYEAFIQGVGGTGGLSVGYTPTWWLEVGILGGVAIGSKELSAGWEQRDLNDGPLVDQNTIIYEPVRGVMGVIEPRLRMFFVPTGPVKPYAIGGAHIRAFDGFDVPDVGTTVNYSDRQGGIGVGAQAGGGLAFEGISPVSGFIEVPWTYLIQPLPHEMAGEDLETVPNQAPGSRQVVQFRAGIGVRL